MSASFFVMKAPDDFQRNQEFRTTDEVGRVTQNGYMFCRTRSLATWMHTNGFESIIDPSGEIGRPGQRGEKGMSFKEARAHLKINGVTLKAMSARGDLIHFNFRGSVAYLGEQIRAIRVLRDRAARKLADHTRQEAQVA